MDSSVFDTYLSSYTSGLGTPTEAPPEYADPTQLRSSTDATAEAMAASFGLERLHEMPEFPETAGPDFDHQLELQNEVFFGPPADEYSHARGLMSSLSLLQHPRGAMSSETAKTTANTTPELMSPPKHQRLASTSSLPIDQLNLLSIRPPGPLSVSSTLSPSPRNGVFTRAPHPENPTINPLQLLNMQPQAGAAVVQPAAKYILPSSSSSPALSTLFLEGNSAVLAPNSAQPPLPKRLNSISAPTAFDFNMNDECFNAISYWLNNTLKNADDHDLRTAEIVVNPTGIIKPPHYRRRNSIQVVSRTADRRLDLRRRRRGSLVEPETGDDMSVDTGIEPATALLPTVVPATTAEPTSKTSPIFTGDDDDDGKPFPCPDCAKQFKRSEHLKRHIRSVHSNIRPFHCKYCDKKFSRSDNLAQHLKTHYKVNSNGLTSIIYGNPNVHNRGGRRASK